MAENKGNPYHDEEGKFTSAEGVGSKSDTPETKDLEAKAPKSNMVFQGIKLKEGFDPKTADAKIKTNIKLQDLVDRLKDLNQCANVPRLQSARDIEEHVEEYFSRQVCDTIDSLYGKSPNCQSYQFRPKGNPNKVLELFPNVLAKYRFRDNHAHYVSNAEYNNLARSSGFIKIYRGMSSTGAKAQAIKDGYVNPNLESFDLLCPNEGNCHGSNIYTSYSYNIGHSYANYGRGTIIYGVLDERNAHVLPESTLHSIKNSLNINSINQKLEQHLVKQGIEQSRASRIANSFGKALSSDIGLVAVLLGVDYFEARDGQSQKNLLNASRWYINREI